jgi:predicted deacylase
MSPGLPDPDPGTIARGWLDIVDHLPTGGPERIPVVVASGEREGPTLWVTGSLHGDEVTGMAVCQDIVHEALPDHLAGRVVSLPNLNPAGLRRTTRTSYYDDEDPNRQFPDVAYVTADADPDDTIDGPRPPSQQELVCRRLFDLFAADADALLDMHTATVDSHPFVIQDRVLYGRGLRDREAALELADDLADLAAATGLPTVFEYPPGEYLDEGLHRSTSGSALNQAGIPALTVELGTHSVVDDRLHRQGVAAAYRVLAHLDMVGDAADAFPGALGSLPEPIPSPVSGQKRRHVGPRANPGGAGIVRHEVAAGDVVAEGEVVARVVDPTGDPATERLLTADHDGWVLCRMPGVAAYEHTPVTWLAIEDDGDPVGTPGDANPGNTPGDANPGNTPGDANPGNTHEDE